MAAVSQPGQAQPEINELINRVLAGNHNEFAGVVRRYQAKIHGMALGYTRNSEAAADLCQEIFLATFESLRRFDQTRSFTNWILRIATHHCYKFLRSARRPTPLHTPEVPLPDPLDISVAEERRQQVLNVFHALNEDMKMVVWLYYFFDRSCDQIADILEISVSLVKVRLFRARQTMGRDLDQGGEGAP